jgi:hypothetical protein
LSDSAKCPHGYFSRPSNRCPWCHGFDATHRNVIPVVGHGNGWLLHQGTTICTSCGGPGDAGWGLIAEGAVSDHAPTMCYGCRSGENTKEAIARRTAHEATRGIKKKRGEIKT